MFHSCSPALGGKTRPPTSHLASSRRSPGHDLKPWGEASATGSISSSSCSAFAPLSSASQRHGLQQRTLVLVASLKPPSGKGFGKKNLVEKQTPSSESPEVTSSSNSSRSAISPQDRPSKSMNRFEEPDDDDVVPEVVTNRMLKRIAITVGIPLSLGLLLFPLFYYLKTVSKLDIPEWLPLVVSMVTFGTAGFGITYGVVSTSWDPAREGSWLGWKEAQVNWPLVWNKGQSKQTKK